jgi:iron(III) transport system substrate-binding protein
VKKSFRVLLATVFILSLVMATACSSGGYEEGKMRVSLYSPETPDMTRQLAEAFEAAHGGTVDVQYAGTNVLVNRMIAELDNPLADVWYGGGGILPFETAVERGIIVPYTPEFAQDWDVYENGIKVRHEDWYWVGVEVFVLGFAYNSDLVDESELPRTWDDLLDPKWKGKIQFPNPAASGTATLMVLSQMMEKGTEAGWEYFDQLVEQANAIPDSGGAPTRAAAMGEALIGIGFDFMAYEAKANGEAVDFVVPERTPVLVNPVSLTTNGPNPEAGKAFIDFLLSKEGQQILADWYHIPIHPEVESKTPLSVESVMPHAMDLDIDWVLENFDDVRNGWRERYQ